MVWKIIMILGILGVVLGFLVTAISVALPPLTNGRTSWEEAMLGIIPGAVVLVLSFFLAVLGLIFVHKNRKRPPQG
jgi:hypothetical protein